MSVAAPLQYHELRRDLKKTLAPASCSPAAVDWKLVSAAHLLLFDPLYFVVDILKCQGERNAYDKIDFDSMVLDTLDALQAYHTAAKTSESEDGAHSILILDKALHAFP